MKLKKRNYRFKSLLKLIYLKLFRTNDSAHKIAGGLALGVFLGILPTTGPIAALVVSGFLGVNRASALLGSLLTNTWINIATLGLALKIGNILVKEEWLKAGILNLPILKQGLPLLAGYFVIALGLGIAVYVLALGIINMSRFSHRFSH
jgi:uncharacterized protein